MVKNVCKRLVPFVLALMLMLSAMPLQVFAATTVNVLDGQITITDTATNMSESGGVVTVTAKGGRITATTNTITITNETESKAKLTFSYSASGYGSFSESSASGNYEANLDAGDSVTMSIKGTTGLFGYTNGVLTLSNFSLVAVSDSSDVTFNFDDRYGSITVGGTAIASGDSVNIPLTGTDLVATAVSGGQFYGWVDMANGVILSASASYKIEPAQDMNVKAVFIGADSAPHFMIGGLTRQTFKYGFLSLSTGEYWTVASGTHLFDNLNDAAAASGASATSKGIVLLNSGTLPAGTYTIPASSTFVVPFDSSNTLYKTVAQGRVRVQNSSDATKDETYTHGYTVYRNLTMADGAHIVLNGDMCVPAKHLYAQGAATGGGSPVDNVAMVTMQGNSSITINNGGSLYAYGFITGSGSVVANSGANVYEYFQLTDFRGGDQSTQMKNGVFPVSQYYVQNIEVPLTLYHGASEYSFTTLYMSASAMASSVKFISSSGAMFNLTEGYVTKRYDGSTDRLIIELEGKMNVSPIKMDMGTSSLDSDEYELPVNSNISITAKSGSVITMNQDVAMLPGSEIIIEQGANATIGKGVNVYIYGVGDWGTYAGAINRKVIPVINAPGRTYNRTEADLTNARIVVDGYIDASQGYVYTTASGADIISNGTGVALMTEGSETVTYQVIQAGDPKNSNYVAIPITPAKLTNADGTIISTGTDTYTYSDGMWNCTNHSYTTVVTDHTCTEPGYTTYTCVACGHSYNDDFTVPEHSYTSEDFAATCTEGGYTKYTCTICGDTYSEPNSPANGHSFGDWSVRTEAGCESKGLEVRTCSVCNAEDTREIEANGHSYTSVVTEPTCTEQGYTTHTCSVCDDSYDDTYVAALGHSYNEVVTAPTCTNEGYTTYTCSVCENSYKGDVTDPTGHTMGDWIIDKDADCVNNGTKHKECADCSHTETEVIPAKGHSYTSVVTAPTCTEQGYTTHTCSACGDSYADTYVDATGHSHNAVVTAPTCTEKGYTTYTCACGDSYVDDYVDATGHSFGEWVVTSAATHSKEGVKTRTCTACEDGVETEAIPMIICDADGDGVVGALELSKMRKFLVDTAEPTAEEIVLFDMDDNGVINLKDLVRLKRYIAAL